jgi:multicomponent Na+:H+ antiporter subunit E
MRTISLAAFLCLFWFVSSGSTAPLLLGSMLVACVLVVALSRHLGAVDAEGHPVHLLPRVLRFWTWLSVQVVHSNLRVARLVLDPRPRIAPGLVRVHSCQRDDLGRTILANCTTLTPGTVTLEVGDDWLLVHTLLADGTTTGRLAELDRRIAALDPRGAAGTDHSVREHVGTQR